MRPGALFVAAPPVPAGVPAGLPAIRVVDSFSTGLTAPGVWNDLVRESGATPYQTHEWLSGWWEAFGQGRGRSLYIIVFTIESGESREAGDAGLAGGKRVAGYVPLFSEQGSLPGTIRLRFVGSGDSFSRTGGRLPDNGLSDYLDFILPASLPGHPDLRKTAGEAFRRHLSDRRTTIESVDLVNLRPDGAAMTAMAAVSGAAGKNAIEPTHGYETSIMRSDRCPFIRLEADATDYVATREAGVRRRLRQAMKTVPGGELTLRMAFSKQDLDEMFPRLVSLHQERWNRAGFTGLFGDPRAERFQKRVAEAFLGNGWLWFGTLSDGGGAVAARLGFTFGGTLYDYLSGFDDISPAAKKRPGIALLMQMYNDARSSGVGTLDLLRGDETYKAELGSGEIPLYSIRLLNGGLAGGSSLRRDLRGLIGFHLRREADLLSVQRKLHGWAMALPAYLRFRTSRLRRKINQDNTKAST